MNKKIIYSILLTIVVSVGCKKEDVSVWTGRESIYFATVLDKYIDSTLMTFALSPATVKDSVFKLPIGILGLPASSDRTFTLKVDPSSTAVTGKHFTLPSSFVMRAGKTTDTVSITFHRTVDLASTGTLLLLNLVPNENFNTDFTSYTHYDKRVLKTVLFKISLNDMISLPVFWPDYYYSTFSKKKILLMNHITGMPMDSFNNFDSYTKWVFWGTQFQRWLNDQKAAGNTILDENGTPMMMDPSMG